MMKNIWDNINYVSYGPSIICSGTTIVNLPGVYTLGSYTTSTTGIPNYGQYYYPIPPTLTIPSTTIPSTTIPNITITGMSNIFIKDAFRSFIKYHLENKCLMFDNLYEKTSQIVNRIQALRFAWSFFDIGHFVSVPKYIDHKELFFKDEEWHIYFKIAKTSEELIEILDFSTEEIEEIVSLSK